MNIKRFISTLLVVIGLGFSAGSSAITMADVGGIDPFIDSTTLPNSGDATEEAWVESVLGFDVTMSSKYDSDGSDWMLVDGYDDVYALMMETNPAYFLIKIGTGGTNLDSHYLFQNIFELAWAVVDFSSAGIDFTIQNIGIDRMSHVDEFNGSDIPEPLSILLLGLGLLGYNHRRKVF